MNTELPEGVGELLANRIDSFEKLELVVALHGMQRATASVDELSKALKVSRTTLRQAALELRAVSLVELTTGGEVQLLPPTSRDREAIDKLVKLYNEDRFAVVKAMGEIALHRIRNMASRAFADAFVIRKKPEGGDDG